MRCASAVVFLSLTTAIFLVGRASATVTNCAEEVDPESVMDCKARCCGGNTAVTCAIVNPCGFCVEPGGDEVRTGMDCAGECFGTSVVHPETGECYDTYPPEMRAADEARRRAERAIERRKLFWKDLLIGCFMLLTAPITGPLVLIYMAIVMS